MGNRYFETKYILRVIGEDEFYVMNPESVVLIDNGICGKCFTDKAKIKVLSLSEEQSLEESLFYDNLLAEKPLNFE